MTPAEWDRVISNIEIGHPLERAEDELSDEFFYNVSVYHRYSDPPFQRGTHIHHPMLDRFPFVVASLNGTEALLLGFYRTTVVARFENDPMDVPKPDDVSDTTHAHNMRMIQGGTRRTAQMSTRTSSARQPFTEQDLDEAVLRLNKQESDAPREPTTVLEWRGKDVHLTQRQKGHLKTLSRSVGGFDQLMAHFVEFGHFDTSTTQKVGGAVVKRDVPEGRLLAPIGPNSATGYESESTGDLLDEIDHIGNMRTASFGFPTELVSSNPHLAKPIEGVQVDEFIKEKTRLYRQSWFDPLVVELRRRFERIQNFDQKALSALRATRELERATRDRAEVLADRNVLQSKADDLAERLARLRSEVGVAEERLKLYAEHELMPQAITLGGRTLDL